MRFLSKQKPMLFLLSFFFLSEVFPSTADPNIFAFRLNNEVTAIDWQLSQVIRDSLVIRHLMDGLFAISPKNKLEKRLCETYSQSPDQKRYTFQIRRGIKWTDGVELTSQHFIDSWERLTSPATAAPNARLLKGALFKATGPYSLEVILPQPKQSFLWSLTQVGTFPIRKDVIERHGAGWASPGRIVTLGAYTLQSVSPGQEIVLGRNATYWRKLSPRTPDKIIARVVKDDLTAENLFSVGKLDYLADLTMEVLNRYERDPRLKWMDPLKVFYLVMNPKYSPFLWSEIRCGVAQSIDKSGFKKLFGPSIEAATAFVPSSLPGHDPKLGLPFNPPRAKHAFFERSLSPKSISVEIATLSSDKAKRIGEWVQSELRKNTGLDVSLRSFDAKTFQSLQNSKTLAVFITGWGADYPDGDNFLEIFTTGGHGGRSLYQNPKYDRLYAASLAEPDPKTRSRLYSEAQRDLLQKDCLMVPLFYDKIPVLISSRIKRFDLGPEMTLNFSGWEF